MAMYPETLEPVIATALNIVKNELSRNLGDDG